MKCDNKSLKNCDTESMTPEERSVHIKKLRSRGMNLMVFGISCSSSFTGAIWSFMGPGAIVIGIVFGGSVGMFNAGARYLEIADKMASEDAAGATAGVETPAVVAEDV